jgi:response regulator NasT
MFQVSRGCGGRSRCSSTRATSASIQASVDAGVSAYIVDGLKKERIKPILDLCISRFNAFSKLRDELTAQIRAGRPQGDRPRQGHPDEVEGLTEDKAYVLLRSPRCARKRRSARSPSRS